MNERLTVPNGVSMIIVVGPSGVGKSTLVDKAKVEFPQLFDTTTYTTRAMRKGEHEGSPYHFVSDERFRELIEQDFFVEWAHVHNKLYGTPKHQIDDAIGENRIVIMDVDVQGARTFKEKYPAAFSVFVLPPSIDELRQRIKRRDKMDGTELDLRLENARKEIAQAKQFDIQIVNADINLCYKEFKKIIEEILKNR